MKNLIYFFSILILFACNEVQVKDADIPWYVSEKLVKGIVEKYNYADSLNKYQVLKKSQIGDNSKYTSYITDLAFKTGAKPKQELVDQLESIFKNDKDQFCKELIQPTLKYITPISRPSRRFSQPYIVDLDFDYFIEKCIECNLLVNSTNIEYEIGKFRLSHVMLKDQWFRIPHRTQMPHIQDQYDIENREIVDELYASHRLDLTDKEIQSNIYILLLHSTDCEWTEKWLKIYINECGNYPKFKQNLSHFVWRSTCNDVEAIANMAKKAIHE